jgi:hypothetical protein
MKTIKISIVAGLALVSFGLSAQTYKTTPFETDTVAPGSKAKYKVDLYFNDIAPSPLFNASGVNWAFPAGYTAADYTQINGSSALTTGADAAYDQKEIVMGIKSAAGTTLTLTAKEQSRPISGTGCADAGAGESRTIVVVALPTATFGADSGGCALPATISLPVNFTGYGNYDVRFAIQAKDMLGVNVGAAFDIDMTNIKNVRTTQTGSLVYVAVNTATFPALATGGYYVITMSNLQDRISKKTLNYAFNTTQVANATPTTGDVYNYYVYPTPTTQPIQHVNND